MQFKNHLSDVHYKAFRAELKQVSDEGDFEAVIATLNTTDKDGDIIVPGAFEGTGQVSVLNSHDTTSLMLGKATIEERGDLAVAKGKLNLETQAGRDLHATLKFDLNNPPSIQEWSFGFRTLDADHSEDADGPVRMLKKLDVLEVSPVLRGAGVGTGTVAAKAATPKHKTESKDDVWDPSANERCLPSPMDRKTAEAVYALVDGKNDKVAKCNGLFLHHYVNEDGSPGPASVKALHEGIAILNGADGGANLGEAQRKSVYEHLASHLKDAGEEPAGLLSLKEVEEKGPTTRLVDQIRMAKWRAEAVHARMKEVIAMHETKGREPSVSTQSEMQALQSELKSLAAIADMDVSIPSDREQEATQKAVAAYYYAMARSSGAIDN